MSLRDKEVEVRWEVSDGYVGGSRPHYLKVAVEDYEGLDRRGIVDLLYEDVEGQALQEISIAFDVDGVADQIEAALARD